MKRILIIISFITLLISPGIALSHSSEIPNTNILYRVLPIKVGSDLGTAFTIEVDGKQYLITAKHITNNQAVEVVEIWRNGGWNPIKVRTVGIGKEDEDIIVLATDERLTATFEIELGAGGIVLGQNVKFLGFPFGIKEYMNHPKEWGIPTVKGGILTIIIEPEKDVSWLLVDGHGNKGFSGGPVVFKPLGEKDGRWKIAGVTSRWPRPIKTARAVVTDNKTGEIIGYTEVNTGIVVATGIEVALNLIKSNPIGFPVKES